MRFQLAGPIVPLFHTSHTIPAPEARHLGGVGVTYQGKATPEPEGESPPGTRLRQQAAALHIPLRPVWVALRENWLRRGQDILTPYLCRFAGNLVAAVTGCLTPWVTCRSCPAFPIVPLFHTSHTSHTSPAFTQGNGGNVFFPRRFFAKNDFGITLYRNLPKFMIAGYERKKN